MGHINEVRFGPVMPQQAFVLEHGRGNRGSERHSQGWKVPEIFEHSALQVSVV